MITETAIAVERQVHRFYQFVDAGSYESAAGLFDADAVLEFGPGAPKPGTVRGPDIAKALVARRTNGHPTSRHACSNLVVDGPDGAISSQSLLTIYRFGASPYPFLIADVTQHWRLVEGEWKMAAMHIIPVIETP